MCITTFSDHYITQDYSIFFIKMNIFLYLFDAGWIEEALYSITNLQN